MAALDAHRWRRASPHLDRVLDLAPADREACLASLRTADPEVAADVQALLDQHRDLHLERFLEDTAAMVPPGGPLAGMTLGAYTLVEAIGRGGMGSVWLATRSDGRFEGRAAVKLLNAELIGRVGGRALQARRHDPRPADAPAHRPADRRRRVADRPALPGAGAHRRPAHRSLLRGAGARRRGAHPAVPGRAVGGGPRAREPDRPPRPETVERARERRTARSSSSISASPSCSKTTRIRRGADPRGGRRARPPSTPRPNRSAAARLRPRPTSIHWACCCTACSPASIRRGRSRSRPSPS